MFITNIDSFNVGEGSFVETLKNANKCVIKDSTRFIKARIVYPKSYAIIMQADLYKENWKN